MRYLTLLLVALSLTACVTPGRNVGPAGEFLKTDLDRVADAHVRELQASLRRLSVKLYRRNPRQWRRGGQVGLQEAIDRIWGSKGAYAQGSWGFPELGQRTGAEALNLAFDEGFSGDRVLAFSVGLASMLDTAFDSRREFFVLDSIDAQKLFNSARNIEIAVWRLSHKRDSAGELYLLTNEMNGESRNLSFEREFGRMIGNLDVLAAILSGRGQRIAVHAVQNMATATFLPLF